MARSIFMDWLPWRIACNFIRAFCPTLIVLASWDLWSNLSHAGRARPLAIVTDVVAMGVVLSIRLAPPLTQARKQFKYLSRWFSLGLGSALLLQLLFHKPAHVHLRDGLLLITAYVLYTDIARLCKISLHRAERGIEFIYMTFGVVWYFVAGAVSFVRTLSQGVLSWSEALNDVVSVLIVAALLLLVGWWWQRRSPDPVIQELGLNQ